MLKTRKMFHSQARLVIILCLSLSLLGCSNQVTGLQKYSNVEKGYEFAYPNGWIKVEVEKASPGVDVVFRDLIERSENLSVIISEVGDNQSLTKLGTASEVGYRFMKQVNLDPKINRSAELISASSHQNNQNVYYILEYLVKPPSGSQRHSLASVVVSGNKLYTFNLSTSQPRWDKVKKLFEAVANSFSVS